MPGSILGDVGQDAAAGTAFGPWGTVIGAGVGLVSGLIGASQAAKAKKLAQQNPFPNMPIPQGVIDSEKIAEEEANTGLPSEQYNQAKQNIQRQQAQQLSSATDRRGGLMAVAGTQQGTNDANLALDVQNANARIAARRNLIGVKQNLGEWQNRQFDWNQKQKYIQTAAAARALYGAGTANINQGIDRIAGAATGYFGRGGRLGLFGGGGKTGNRLVNPNADPYGYDLQGAGTDTYDTTA